MPKQAGSIALLITAVALLVASVFGLRGRSSGEPRRYFYDLSEARLYSVPHDTLPPHTGVGGAPDDGYEALVVRCPKCDPHRGRVAYLLMLTPELKHALMMARDSEAGGEELSREFVFKNTLVRRLEDDDWKPLASDEGKAIRDGWAGTCAEHGLPAEPASP